MIIPINRKKPVVGNVFIVVLAAVFVIDRALAYLLVGRFGFGPLTLFGIKQNALIAAGQYWRLITPVLLHADAFHLLSNAFGFFIWGKYVELLYGRGKMIAVLLLSGLLGTLASYAFNDANSLGASGAVFGLFGALLAVRNFNRDFFNRFFGAQLFVYLGINLVWGFTNPYIDNAGHIGGLVGGFLCGCMLGLVGKRRPSGERAIFALALAALCVLFFTWRDYLLPQISMLFV